MKLPMWLRRWLTDGQDDWQGQTPVVKFTGYDERKASAGYRRSRWQTETGRAYAKAITSDEKVRRIK